LIYDNAVPARGINGVTIPIGGSARGYQGLSARLAISTTDDQAAAQAVCLCMANAGRECALLPLCAGRATVPL
jgi:hypothetical protein